MALCCITEITKQLLRHRLNLRLATFLKVLFGRVQIVGYRLRGAYTSSTTTRFRTVFVEVEYSLL